MVRLRCNIHEYEQKRDDSEDAFMFADTRVHKD